MTYFDEFIDEMMTKDRVCDIILPRLTQRSVLEETEGLPPRKSLLVRGIAYSVSIMADIMDRRMRTRRREIVDHGTGLVHPPARLLRPADHRQICGEADPGPAQHLLLLAGTGIYPARPVCPAKRAMLGAGTLAEARAFHRTGSWVMRRRKSCQVTCSQSSPGVEGVRRGLSTCTCTHHNDTTVKLHMRVAQSPSLQKMSRSIAEGDRIGLVLDPSSPQALPPYPPTCQRCCQSMTKLADERRE